MDILRKLDELQSLLNSEIKEIKQFLNSENTEGVSTSSRTESGVSHGVSGRNASRSDSTEDSKEVVGGTLALRTEAQEVYCPKCKTHTIENHMDYFHCTKCDNYWELGQ